MTCPPLEQQAGMPQNEHWAVEAGMDFRPAGTSENISQAFSNPYTISAFFFATIHPPPSNPPPYSPASCPTGKLLETF
jgi:hypothetical protein